MQDSNKSRTGTMKMWVKYLYDKPNKIGKIKNVKYVMEKQAINYLDKTMLISDWYFYSQNGEVLYSNHSFIEEEIIPGSIGDCIVGFVEFMFEEFYKKDIDPLPILQIEQKKQIDLSKVKWDKKKKSTP